MEHEIIERIVELWSLPPELDVPRSYETNPAIDATMVWQALASTYDREEVRNALGDFLKAGAREECTEEMKTLRHVFLMNRCLELCRSIQELALDVDAARELICKLPSVGYYSAMEIWVTRYFDKGELLDVLASGIETADNDCVRASCLFGLRLYLQAARPPSSPERFLRGLESYEAAVRSCASSGDSLIREGFGAALKNVWQIRRTRPELPRVRPDDLRAQRHDEGDAVRYTVERIADGYPVLHIPRFEIKGRLLILEFSNQEPTLLPEEVPSIVEATLLKNQLAHYTELVDEVRYVDLHLKKTVQRPVQLKT
jgi:hypothetical protein